MPASEDDAGIPLVFTARTPGYVPPKEYVQFLDMGGELARLFSLKEVKALKAAVQLLKNRMQIHVQLYYCRGYLKQQPNEKQLFPNRTARKLARA